MKDKFSVIKHSDYESVSLFDPGSLLIRRNDPNKPKQFLPMNKSTSKEVYGNLGISKQVSNKVYNVDPNTWKQLITICSTKQDDDGNVNTFNLSDYSFIVYEDTIVGITTNEDIADSIDKLFDMFDEFKYCLANSAPGIIKIVLDIETYDTCAIICMVEMNFDRGIYKMSMGVRDDSRIILMPASVLKGEFEKFLEPDDIRYEISLNKSIITNVLNKNGSINMDEIYSYANGINIKLSLREVLDVLKASGIKMILEKNGTVSTDNDTSDLSLSEYFNMTGQTFKSLKKLSYLNKSIKFPSIDINLDEMLLYVSSMFTEDYIVSDGIDMLVDIYNKEISDFETIKRSDINKIFNS